MSEKSSAGFVIEGTRISHAPSQSSVRACGGLLFIYLFFPMDLYFFGRHPGFGIQNNAGTTSLFSPCHLICTTIISYSCLFTGLLCSHSLQMLGERSPRPEQEWKKRHRDEGEEREQKKGRRKTTTKIKRERDKERETDCQDFLIMFIHHLTAVVLITTSYITNMVRVGVLILCLHDVSDSFLEVAKMANYAKYQRLCDATFILFTVMFIATRLGIFPIWILNTTLFESWEIIGPYPSWWFFNGFLLVLQLLHVVWSYFIICVAYKALARGKVLKDERSDVESSSEGEDGTSNSRKGILSTSSNGANRINGHIMNDQQTEEE
ncbi:ceramide synthase 5 isoform X4 [Hemicordylus capensis]|uniref:ceramide synthase 5 isoform X4 n=1 Tax=Hemicordylus capensis TaxID=884348 RepID=UPI0023028DE7|nr:ceramide synthase 5 isoform X4 [Hemicordylus capensis]